MVPILTVLSDAVGIFGGSLISVTSLGLSWEFYWRSVGQTLVMNDFAMGLTKPVVFGFILTSVGCFMGLRTRGGTQGVGRATTNAVVAGSVGVIAVDFFLTPLLIELLY